MATTTEIVITGIPEFEAASHPTIWMARGHHDQVAFAHTLMDDEEFRRWDDSNGGTVCALHVHHEYWRAVPHGPEEPGRYSYQQSGPGRGAFPVTVFYA